MKNLFAFIGVVLVVVIGVGIWQNWFKIDFNSKDGKVYIEGDVKKAEADGKEFLDKGKEKLNDLKKKDDGGVIPPANTPGPFGSGK